MKGEQREIDRQTGRQVEVKERSNVGICEEKIKNRYKDRER
jgi:hypothetical protein